MTTLVTCYRVDITTDGHGRMVERETPCTCPAEKGDLETQFPEASTAGEDRRCECGASLEGLHKLTQHCRACAKRKHAASAAERKRRNAKRRCLDCPNSLAGENPGRRRCPECARAHDRLRKAEYRHRRRAAGES